MERVPFVEGRGIAPDELLDTELSARYEITGLLGRGGFGTVYRAVHRNTGQDVAVKVLRVASDWSPAAIEKQIARFEREASLCSGVQHPNIVRLLERGRPDGGVCFAVYEYIPGRTLGRVLAEQGTLPPAEAAEIMGQVLDALACAHGRGIVHRDLKPENIMIVEGGQRVHVKVLDFGVGTLVPAARNRDYRDLTLTRETVGTPSYSAPEQLRGEPPTPKTDIYSWGLVLLECLTGHAVFEGTTLAAIYHQQLSPQEIDLPSSLAGHPLAEFLRRVLHKQPVRRAGDAAQLYKDFRALNVGDLVGNLAPARPSAQQTPVRHHRSTIAANSLGPTPELRHVTVLSTSVTVAPEEHADIDFEQLDVIQREQNSLSHDTLVRYGGHLASSVCDRSLVYFGYPSASDSDARRAARTALELAEEVRRRSHELYDRHAVRLTFRIGLHSGMVCCDRPDVAPSGLTPTTALRIEALAPANTIVVSEPTRRLLLQYVEFRPLARSSAESASEPLGLHALLGELHAESLSARVSSERTGRLWGRDNELEFLRERFQASTGARKATSVLVSGEAGIGKSRLLRALEREVMDQDVPVHELRCLPDAKNAALAPVLAFLRRHLELTDAAPAECAERLCTAIENSGLDAEVLAPIFCAWLLLPRPARYAATPIAISPPRQRQLLLEASARMLCRLDGGRPALVLVEDLHWADPTTLEWLDVLGAAEAPLCVVMTTRPEPQLALKHAGIHRLELGRLQSSECMSLMRELAAERTRELPGERLFAELAERADGIPLFAEELTRTLFDTRPRDTTQPLFRSQELAIPDTLRELLTERLDRMGAALEVAQVASALGREFDEGLLRSALGYDEPVLDGLLDRLVRADLVRRRRQVGHSIYVFRHALVRDAAYDSMPRDLRRSAHARIACALEAEPEEVRRLHSADLFHHFSAAQAPGTAARYGLIAGQEALTKSSNAEALGYAQAVLEAIPQAPAAERAPMEVAASSLRMQALLATEGWASPNVRESIERTLALLSPEDDGPARLGVLYALFQHFHVASERKECRRVVEELQRIAARSGDASVQAMAETAEGVCFHAEGKFGEARVRLEHARSLYVPPGEGSTGADNGLDCYAWASAQLALVETYRGETERALTLAHEAIDWARKLNHVPSLSIALLYIAQIHQFEDRREDAIAVCDELLGMAATYGLPAFEAYAATIRAWATDDLDGVRAVTATLRGMNCNLILTYYVSFLAHIELRRGNVTQALVHADDGLALCTEIDEHCFEAELHRRRAALLLAQPVPDRPAALAALERSVALARLQDMGRIEAMALADLERLGASTPAGLSRLQDLARERPCLARFATPAAPNHGDSPGHNVREAC